MSSQLLQTAVLDESKCPALSRGRTLADAHAPTQTLEAKAMSSQVLAGGELHGGHRQHQPLPGACLHTCALLVPGERLHSLNQGEPGQARLSCGRQSLVLLKLHLAWTPCAVT